MQFVALEIDPVRETESGTEVCASVDADYWALYGRCSDGKAHWIADHDTRAAAEAVRAALNCYTVTRAPAPVWFLPPGYGEFLGSYLYQGDVYDLYVKETADSETTIYRAQFGASNMVGSVLKAAEQSADHPLRQAFHLATIAAYEAREQHT